MSRHLRRAVLVLYFLGVLLVSSILPTSGTGLLETAITGASSPSRILIHTQRLTFDPLSENPPVPASLRAVGLDQVPAGSRYHVVQFDGPVTDSYKAQVTAAGAELLEYLPDFAFVARIAPSDVPRVQRVSAVRWVGPLFPILKVSPGLDHDISSNTPVVVQVRTYPGEDVSRIAHGFGASGATVLFSSPTQPTRSGYFRLSARGNTIALVARADGVAWVEKYVPMHIEQSTTDAPLQNNTAADVLGVNTLRETKGYFGQGQVVGIADTGLDSGYDPSMGSTPQGAESQRKVTALASATPVTQIPTSQPNGQTTGPIPTSPKRSPASSASVRTTTTSSGRRSTTQPTKSLRSARALASKARTSPRTSGKQPSSPPAKLTNSLQSRSTKPHTDAKVTNARSSPRLRRSPRQRSRPVASTASRETSGLPDLTVTSLYTNTYPLVEGQPYDLEWEVDNIGSADATQTFYTDLYIGGQYVTSWYTNGLPAGWYTTGSGTFTTSPAGTWDVTVITDSTNVVSESDESNNTLTITLTWQSSGLPDLTVSSIWTTTSPLVSGQSYDLEWEVDNIGNADATETFYTDLYIGGQYVTSWYTNGLSAGWYTTAQGNFTTSPAGTWDVTVVTDSSNAVPESNESNNSLTVSWTWEPPPLPDLTVSNIWTTTSPLIAGQPYDLEFEVDNVGNADVTQTFYTDLYVAGQYVNSWYTNGLSAGYSTFGQETLTTSLPGTWDVTAVTDSTNVVQESDESNNSLTVSWTWSQGQPDLTVSNVWTTTSPLVEGQSFHLEFEVDNVGTADVTQTFYTDLNIGGIFVQRWSTDGLPPGSGAIGQGDFTVSPAGNWVVAVDTDSTGVVDESDESNNVWSASWTWNPLPLHPDIQGRVNQAYALDRPGDWSDLNGHGTHVTGSVLGNGTESGANPSAHQYVGSMAGSAPEAHLVFQSVGDASDNLPGLPADLNDLFITPYDDGARIHSDSWGNADAGAYSSSSLQADEFVWNHPDMLIFIAAGNAGQDADHNGVTDLGSVGSPSTAKDVVAVGATEGDHPNPSGGLTGRWGDYTWGNGVQFTADPIRSDFLSNNPGGMAAWSSRGPAADGRIKPDVVGPGTNIISTLSQILTPSQIQSNTWGQYSSWYAYMGGTSMATPLVAGATTLVREYLMTGLGIGDPSAALIRAFLVNGATDIAPGQYGTGTTQEIPYGRPNDVEGWGRVNVAESISPSNGNFWYDDHSSGLSTGNRVNYWFNVGTGNVRVALVWSDYAAREGCAPCLVNDLDLTVTDPTGATTYPNGGTAADRLNNTETVYFTSGQAGLYEVSVSAYNVPEGPQPYALVVTGPGLSQVSPPAAPVLQSPANGSVIDEQSVLTLCWNTVSGATAYQAQIWGGQAGTIASGWQTDSCWSVGQMAPGVTYSWDVQSENSAGTGPWSSAWNVGVRPSAPSMVAAEASSCSAVDLAWLNNSGGQQGFRVYRDGAFVGQTAANVTYFSDTGLTSNTSYTYVVTAYSGDLESGPSNTAPVTTPSCVPTVTITPTLTLTPTWTISPTIAVSTTPTISPTVGGSVTPTMTLTETVTQTPPLTITSTLTPSLSPTWTSTTSPTIPSSTLTPVLTSTSSATPTSAKIVAAASNTPTTTFSATASVTDTSTSNWTQTPTYTPTLTATPTTTTTLVVVPVTPGIATTVTASVGSTVVTLDIPTNQSIAQLAFQALDGSAVPPPSDLFGRNALVALDVSAVDSTGQPVTSVSEPLTISLQFASAAGTNAYLARICTLDSSGNTQSLTTNVVANGDGTFTATARSSHLSPFAVYAPGRGTPLPQVYIPFVSNDDQAVGKSSYDHNLR